MFPDCRLAPARAVDNPGATPNCWPATVERPILPSAAQRFEQEPLRLLVAPCHQLQEDAGDKPFFLDCRAAEKHLAVPKMTIWRWLQLLQTERIIKLVQRGSAAKHRVSLYRYIAD